MSFFSGNDIYWQVRYEQIEHLMVCYKNFAGQDPMWQIDPSLVTTRWDLPPLNRPGETLQGVRFQAFSLQYEPEDLLVQMSSHMGSCPAPVCRMANRSANCSPRAKWTMSCPIHRPLSISCSAPAAKRLCQAAIPRSRL